VLIPADSLMIEMMQEMDQRRPQFFSPESGWRQ